MKNFLSIFMVLLMFSSLTSAETGTSDATAKVVSQISVESITDLDIGDVAILDAIPSAFIWLGVDSVYSEENAKSLGGFVPGEFLVKAEPGVYVQIMEMRISREIRFELRQDSYVLTGLAFLKEKGSYWSICTDLIGGAACLVPDSGQLIIEANNAGFLKPEGAYPSGVYTGTYSITVNYM